MRSPVEVGRISPRRGGTGRTSRLVVALTARTRSREGATVSPQASMTEPYEPSSRAADTGRPTVDQ